MWGFAGLRDAPNPCLLRRGTTVLFLSQSLRKAHADLRTPPPHHSCFHKSALLSIPGSPCRSKGLSYRQKRAVPRLACNCTQARPLATKSKAAEQTASLLPLDGDYEKAHAFSAFAHWLLPGRVLLGRYPFLEPSRCRNRSQGEAQLQQLLLAGVSVFICLQAELPRQEAMRIGGHSSFMPYLATAKLIAAALKGPPDLAEAEGLRNKHIDRYLPPRRKGVQQADADVKAIRELSFVHFPIEDLGIPTTAQVDAIIQEVAARLADEEVLYIHCWGGRGRAGTIGACLLGKLFGISATEALARVQRSFDTREDDGRLSPETREQVNFVHKYLSGREG